jgi:hypothetical protein
VAAAHIALHFDTKIQAAEYWQVRPNYLSMILNGSKPPTARASDAVGFWWCAGLVIS